MEYDPRTAFNRTAVNASELAPVPRTTNPKAARAESVALGEKLAAEMEVFDRVAKELRDKLSLSGDASARAKEVVKVAAELFGVAPTWVAFFREVLAREGVIASLFPQAEDRKAFQLTDEFGQVLDMLTALRSRDLPENDRTEVQRMITVRIPKCVHDYICDEANSLQVSVNKLCISRLLQRSDERMIPTSAQKRRGRKPGSANRLPTTSSESPTNLMS